MLCNAEHLIFRFLFWYSISLFVENFGIQPVGTFRKLFRPFFLTLADILNDLLRRGFSGKLNPRKFLFASLLDCLFICLFSGRLTCLFVYLFACRFNCHSFTSRRFSDCIILKADVRERPLHRAERVSILQTSQPISPHHCKTNAR